MPIDSNTYPHAPPHLVPHTFYTEDVSALTRWVMNLKPKSHSPTFFNFLDSHDGIGLMAVKNILRKEKINFIIQKAEKHGGYISYKNSPKN